MKRTINKIKSYFGLSVSLPVFVPTRKSIEDPKARLVYYEGLLDYIDKMEFTEAFLCWSHVKGFTSKCWEDQLEVHQLQYDKALLNAKRGNVSCEGICFSNNTKREEFISKCIDLLKENNSNL